MSDLHLFDMMAFVHAGHVNKRSFLSKTTRIGASWETLKTPTGGASLLFNKIYELLGKADIIVVSDRDPTIKKDMIEGYKSNRTYDHGIAVDKAATEYILQQCSIPLLARDGYEADDLAYSIVRDYSDRYDHIYLYTSDSDWYFMINPKVSVRQSSSNSKNVDFATFEDVTGYWYNSITLDKICDGDNSDCIPGLDCNISEMIKQKLMKNHLRGKLGDKEVVRNLFKVFFPSFEYRVDWVFPLYIEGLPIEFPQPDKRMVCNFGAAIKNKNFSGRMSMNFDVQAHVDALCERGLYLIEEENDDYYG